jgi:hypothetical protein
VSTLTPSGQHGALDELGSRLTELEARLREREAELEAVRVSLAAFRVRYRQDVGMLHDELDELERALAEAELGEIEKRIHEAESDSTEASAVPPPDTTARFTSDPVRKLFRDVAKAIHPDLAEDHQTRERRHALMVQANRAYALGDEELLRSILDAWKRSPESVRGSDPEAIRLRLSRRVAQIEEELLARAGELAELQESPLWKLKTMVDEASAKGKDLVDDMVRRLQRDIMITRNRLDAITWRP